MQCVSKVSAVPIALLCGFLSAPSFAQTDQCLAHFKESGSVSTGKILETDEEFPGLDVPTALRRLQAQLPDGVTIVNVDAEHGIMRVENKSPNSRPFPMEFTFTAIPSGTRVRLWTQMRAGMKTVGGTKPAICGLIRLANVEPPPPAPPPAPIPAPKPEDAGLTNQGVVSLVAADLGDEIVIAKLKNAPKVTFDLSTEALQALKKAKVSSPVIAAMIERAARPPVDASARPGSINAPSEAASPKTASKPPDPCADIELMGLFKEDMRPMSPLIIYQAKIRNASSMAKIVRLEWLDMYAEAMQSTTQVDAGQIVTLQLAAQGPFQRQPINLRLASCR